MTNSTGNINHNWSIRLIQLLYFVGVRDICIASGSRSAPLTIAAETLVSNHFESQDPIELHGHFDERGLGFFALGIAKAKSKPVAVITTSGTAVANLLPAAIEANQTGVPLILITADRPDELLDCGANQAIRQKHIFGEQVQGNCSLPTPSSDLSPNVLASLLEPLLIHLGNGPIHINCPFRDPLYPDTPDNLYLPAQLKNPFTSDQFLKPAFDNINAAEQLNNIPRIESLIFVGAVNLDEAMQILKWAEQNNHMVVADISSNLRLLRHKNLLPYPELILASKTGKDWFTKVNQVIQFGGRLVSKRLHQWLGSIDSYYIISKGCHYLDPHRKALQIRCDVEFACERLKQIQPKIDLPSEIATMVEDLICQHFDNSYSEISINRVISRLVTEQTTMFIGNSLSIRWMDLLSVPNRNITQMFTNRGASGIDGLIATAAGINHTGKPVVLLLGDTSALHDLNSLALAAQCSHSMTIVVINNQGGSIFNLLPAALLPDINNRWFKCEHSWSFEHAAKMFDIEYHGVSELEEFQNTLLTSQSQKRTILIECRFEPDHATNVFKNFMNQAGEL